MQDTEATTIDVAPGQQRVGRRVPQPLDLVVDRGVLLDVGVRLRDVGLGLVVVVVGDEVLDRVVGQQLAELVGQLRGQGLVRRHDQGRPLDLLDQPGGRRRLAGAGRAEQHDVVLAGLDPAGEILDRGRLVTGRGVVRDHLERRHRALQVGRWTHTPTVCLMSDRPEPEAAASGSGLRCARLPVERRLTVHWQPSGLSGSRAAGEPGNRSDETELGPPGGQGGQACAPPSRQ